MLHVLNSRIVRIFFCGAWLALFMVTPRVSGQLAVTHPGPPEPEWFASSCAAKLFLWGVWGYERIVSTTEQIVQERIERYEQRDMPPPPLGAITTEYIRAKPFLEFLTNQYPQKVEQFLAPDDDEKIAQHIWATMLLNYQDGGWRIVQPRDIRTLLFIRDVVQTAMVPPSFQPNRSQFVDARMVETGARLFVESVAQWEGRLEQLHHPNPHFNRTTHRDFWWTYCAYVGILRSADPDAALGYMTDMVMLKRDNLHRWLWDTDYFMSILDAYAPDLGNELWAHPRVILGGLIINMFPDEIPLLLELTGNALLELTDQIITSPVLFNTHVQVLSAANVLESAGNMAAKVRGVEEFASRTYVDDVAPEHDILHDASSITSAEALREALMKWQYYYYLHHRMLFEQEGLKSSWLGEIVQTRLPIMAAIESIFKNREAPESDDESHVERVCRILRQAEGYIQYGQLVPAYRHEMHEAADGIIHELSAEEELDPKLRDIAARIAKEWEEAKNNDYPGSSMKWDDWEKEIRLSVW